MSQKEKLIRRLKSKPKDFTFNEISALLGYFLMNVLTKEKQAVPGLYLFQKSILQSHYINHILVRSY